VWHKAGLSVAVTTGLFWGCRFRSYRFGRHSAVGSGLGGQLGFCGAIGRLGSLDVSELVSSRRVRLLLAGRIRAVKPFRGRCAFCLSDLCT